MSGRGILCCWIGCWGLSLSLLGAPRGSLASLAVYPPAIHLATADAQQGVVVQATYSDSTTFDVTRLARYSLADAKVARCEGATVTPSADGQTELHVSFAGRTVVVPVKVTKAAVPRPLTFKLDVMPVFLKAGCNSGACHGTSRGKDGFHLSLFGFDPEGDYYRLTREQVGRRINLAIPEESLIIQKGLGRVQHTGGVRFSTNSELCKTLIAWLANGAAKDPPAIPQLTGIDMYPRTAVLQGTLATQQFIVQAHYSDDTDRDVTPLAVFLSNNDSAAKVGENGLVSAAGRGEAFIQARFGEFNVGAPIIVLAEDLTHHWPHLTPDNYIDKEVYAKLEKLRLTPSGLCDDATFIRRAYLDLTGTLPPPEAVVKFMADASSEKRNCLVDQLLARPEFIDLWVMKFGELLEMRSRDNAISPKATWLYFEWLRDQMRANVPWDKIVRTLLTASGSTFRDPPANYFQTESDLHKLAENAAQVFLGTRIQCAQCHNHPFDRWTLNDYYGFAAFFAQVARKPGDDPRENVIFDRSTGEVRHPVTGTVMRPKFLGGEAPEIKGQSRRAVLAEWLTSPANPYFARNLANVVWSHFFGRGIVEPVDDVRINNPASNPGLLDALTAHLVADHYDLKQLARDICTSRTYQLSPQPNETNAPDDRNFSKAAIRRLQAEVLLDCISQVTETQDKFPGLPRGAQAVQIADGNTSTYFLTTFGRASRATVCSCEVKIDPNLSQALHLLNGDTLQNKIEQGGVVRKLLQQARTPDQVIDNLYLRCLSREPTEQELAKLREFFVAGTPPERVLNDVFWSLLNAKEFVFNH